MKDEMARNAAGMGEIN